MICLYVGVCFVLPWTVESLPFMLWRWRNKLKWAPSSFLLPPLRCGLGAGSIPVRAVVYKKQCETRGLFMSLVIHYWIGDVQDPEGVSISQNANYNFWRHGTALLCWIKLQSMNQSYLPLFRVRVPGISECSQWEVNLNVWDAVPRTRK